jgi:hypothetical protein
LKNKRLSYQRRQLCKKQSIEIRWVIVKLV